MGMENGIKHVIQAGVDRYNLSTVDRSHCILEWELKHLPFSVANGEIGVNGKVNRSVIVSRYSSQIERMFNTQFTVRKPSRELTYIEEEDEEKLKRGEEEEDKLRRGEEEDIQVTNKKSDEEVVEKPSEDISDKISPQTRGNNVTIVNLEHKDTIEEESSEEVTVTKDRDDRHVRFTSKVEEIDFKEIDPVNEKTS